MKLSQLTTEKSKAILFLIGGIVVIVLLTYYVNKTFGGIRNLIGNITDGLGLTTSEETKKRIENVNEAKDISTNNNSAWSLQFYKNAPSGALLLTRKTGNNLAFDIWDSVGIFTSQDSEAYAAIKQCKTKSQVSFLVQCFYDLYKKDLLTWLTTQYTKFGTPSETLKLIIDYVNKLPDYKI